MPLSRKLGIFGAVIFVALLFWGGGQPEAAGLFEPPFDKVAHFAAFGGFGLMLWLAFGGRWPWLTLVLAGTVGALDEWRQGFTRQGGESGRFRDGSAGAIACGYRSYDTEGQIAEGVMHGLGAR